MPTWVRHHAGAATYDDAAKTYTVTGGGENMWFAKDAFHFAWMRATGDVSLTADIAFTGAGKDPHRKACLMIRQSLDADSAYVDAALHGDGLTSLQFRQEKGAATHEVQANICRADTVAHRKARQVRSDVSSPRRVKISNTRARRCRSLLRAVLCRHRRLRA